MQIFDPEEVHFEFFADACPDFQFNTEDGVGVPRDHSLYGNVFQSPQRWQAQQRLRTNAHPRQMQPTMNKYAKPRYDLSGEVACADFSTGGGVVRCMTQFVLEQGKFVPCCMDREGFSDQGFACFSRSEIVSESSEAVSTARTAANADFGKSHIPKGFATSFSSFRFLCAEDFLRNSEASGLVPVRKLLLLYDGDGPLGRNRGNQAHCGGRGQCPTVWSGDEVRALCPSAKARRAQQAFSDDSNIANLNISTTAEIADTPTIRVPDKQRFWLYCEEGSDLLPNAIAMDRRYPAGKGTSQRRHSFCLNYPLGHFTAPESAKYFLTQGSGFQTFFYEYECEENFADIGACPRGWRCSSGSTVGLTQAVSNMDSLFAGSAMVLDPRTGSETSALIQGTGIGSEAVPLGPHVRLVGKRSYVLDEFGRAREEFGANAWDLAVQKFEEQVHGEGYFFLGAGRDLMQADSDSFVLPKTISRIRWLESRGGLNKGDLKSGFYLLSEKQKANTWTYAWDSKQELVSKYDFLCEPSVVDDEENLNNNVLRWFECDLHRHGGREVRIWYRYSPRSGGYLSSSDSGFSSVSAIDNIQFFDINDVRVHPTCNHPGGMSAGKYFYDSSQRKKKASFKASRFSLTRADCLEDGKAFIKDYYECQHAAANLQTGSGDENVVNVTEMKREPTTLTSGNL